MTDDERLQALNLSLTNITPRPDAVERIENLRDAAKLLGSFIIRDCPDTRERSLALTHLEEATMWAVKSLVLDSHYAEAAEAGLRDAAEAQ